MKPMTLEQQLNQMKKIEHYLKMNFPNPMWFQYGVLYFSGN